MGWRAQLAFWTVALVALVAVVWLLHGMLLPFVAGMVLAYLLDPLANRIERLGVNRLVATLVIVGTCVLAFVAMVILVAPVLIHQAIALLERLPEYVGRLQTLVTDNYKPWLTGVFGENFADAQIGPMLKQGTGGLTVFLSSLWSGWQVIASVLSLLVIAPVVAVYVLMDWHRMVAAIDLWLPRAQAVTLRSLAKDIDRAIAGFMRGQSGVCLILGAVYAVGFSLSGLHFGLLIGLIGGLISFIPYVGTLTVMVFSVGIAVAQFWPEWTPLLAVIAVNVVGQALESYVLSPYLVGPSVGLHPVWIMFSLFAFGYLFGFVGLMIAIPLAAAIAVLVRFALARYLASPFYTGEKQL